MNAFMGFVVGFYLLFFVLLVLGFWLFGLNCYTPGWFTCYFASLLSLFGLR